MASPNYNEYYVPDTNPDQSGNESYFEEDDRALFITPNTFSRGEFDEAPLSPGLDPEHFNFDFLNENIGVCDETLVMTVAETPTPVKAIEHLNLSSNISQPDPIEPTKLVLPDTTSVEKATEQASPLPAPINMSSPIATELNPEKTCVPNCESNILPGPSDFGEFDISLTGILDQPKANLELSSSSDDEFLSSIVNIQKRTGVTKLKRKSVGCVEYSSSQDPDEHDFTSNPTCPFRTHATTEKSTNAVQTSVLNGANNDCNIVKQNRPSSSKNLCEKNSERPESAKCAQDNPRFHKSTNKEVDDLQRDSKSERTNKQTRWGVAIFKEWCVFAGKDQNFEDMSPSHLAPVLKQFYCELRQKDGSEYSRSSLLCIRSSLARHLKGPPFNRPFNIMSDSDFAPANAVLSGTIKNRKRRGEDTSQRHPPIIPSDLKKLYTSNVFSVDNPKGLQYKTFFELSLYFGRRGREGLRQLKKSNIIFELDENGDEYCTLNFRPFEKNHQGDNHHVPEHEQKMYSTHQSDCPVKSLKTYLSKLNPESQALFQKPKSKNYSSSPIWYTKSEVGINTIAQYMSNISRDASLSRRYTNHCIRATCVTSLRGQKVEAIDIMAVTGHRSISSINSYSTVDAEKRKEMSDKISKTLGKKTPVKQPTTDPKGTVLPLKRGEHFNKLCTATGYVSEDSNSATSDVRGHLNITPQKKRADDTKYSGNIAIVSPSPRKKSTPRKIVSFDYERRQSPRLQARANSKKETQKTAKKLDFNDDKNPKESTSYCTEQALGNDIEPPRNIPEFTQNPVNKQGPTIIIQGGSNITIHYH